LRAAGFTDEGHGGGDGGSEHYFLILMIAIAAAGVRITGGKKPQKNKVRAGGIQIVSVLLG
jgi:hypothetical protein